MEIENLIATNRPRENAGARSANRFNYQMHWGLCKLIELQLKGEPYILLCDYHEDFLVISGNDGNRKVEPYQVKSRDDGRNWTTASLVSQSKAKSSDMLLPSILGKLCGGVAFISDHIQKYYFVTNAHLSAKDINNQSINSLKEIEVTQLSETHKEKIYNSLNTELNLNGKRPPIVYMISDLALQDQENHVKGKIVSFLEEHMKGEGSNSTHVYKALFDEIRRCSTKEILGNDREEIFKQRGISSDDVTSMLGKIQSKHSPDALWQRIESEINNDLSFGERKKLEKAFYQYDLERIDLSNELLQSYRQSVIQSVIEFFDSHHILLSTNVGLLDIVAHILPRVHDADLDDYYQKSIIIREVYEQ